MKKKEKEAGMRSSHWVGQGVLCAVSKSRNHKGKAGGGGGKGGRPGLEVFCCWSTFSGSGWGSGMAWDRRGPIFTRPMRCDLGVNDNSVCSAIKEAAWGPGGSPEKRG